MFLSREIGIQRCQINTKINIYTTLYKSSGFNPKYIYLYGIVWTVNFKYFSSMRYCSVKNCVNNDVSGSEIFYNIRKEWIEQVIWKTKHLIFICSEHFDNNCSRNKNHMGLFSLLEY